MGWLLNDRIRLIDLLRKSPAPAGFFYFIGAIFDRITPICDGLEVYARWEYNQTMKTTQSKTQRWNMRVAEDVDAIVRLAAEQTDQPLTDFVVQAARAVAEDTLADRRVFRLDETTWDEFVELLDRPARPIPELARLLSSASVFDG